MTAGPRVLKLSQQGLLLVCVPLFFELLFLGVLHLLVKQAEQATAREAHAKTVVSSVEQLHSSFYAAAASLVLYSTTHDHHFASRFEVTSNALNAQLEKVRSTLRNGAEENAIMKRVDTLASHLFEILAEIKKTVEEEGQQRLLMGHLNDLTKESMATVNLLMASLDELAALQAKVIKTSPEDEARARQNVQLCILAGVVFNILVSVWLAKTFSSGIVKRLGTVVDNTRRLADKQPLLERLQGDDEIAHVDRVFHDMANQLKESAEKERAVVAMVSHDLRAPLSSVKTFLEALIEGVYKEEEVQQKARGVETNVNRLLTLTSDLLDLEKLEAGQMQMYFDSVPVSSIIEQSVSSVQGLNGCAGVIVQDVPEITVWADEDRTVQVLVNLLANAIKFSPTNESVTLCAIASGETVEFCIEDRGRGVPQELHDHIFERFKQVRNEDGAQGKGTGLGLAICKAIVEQHRGKIGVRSDGRSGSVFWFTLPLRPGS